jgi:inhibitor of KinA sporulation pathway (predicted exonuclease)
MHSNAAASARAELRHAERALLIDLEFTCWEDSLRTQWSDPRQPAEVIEVGLALYSVSSRTIDDRFTALVRPRINPVLSTYCVELLHIGQEDIDSASDLTVVLRNLSEWLREHSCDGLPTCGWAPNDRPRLAKNAAQIDAADPLAGRAHIDLRAALSAQLGRTAPIGRDELRSLARLPANPRRHRALDDALDLTHFLPLLLDDRRV